MDPAAELQSQIVRALLTYGLPRDVELSPTATHVAEKLLANAPQGLWLALAGQQQLDLDRETLPAPDEGGPNADPPSVRLVPDPPPRPGAPGSLRRKLYGND